MRPYLPFIESAPAPRPRFPLLESAPMVRPQCARTFGRYISRSFVDDPFQGSKYLSHHPTFLGEASRQLTVFAPACSSFQASPTLVVAIPYTRLLARHTYRGTVDQPTSIHKRPLVIVAWPCKHSPSTGLRHPRPYRGLVVTHGPSGSQLSGWGNGQGDEWTSAIRHLFLLLNADVVCLRLGDNLR